MMNLTLPSQLKVTLLVERLEIGRFVASIYEFPGCRVEADTRETAIEQVQSAFLDRLKHIETIPWNVPLETVQPAWMKYAGIFENDPDFAEIMDSIRAERTSEDDSEVDPSYYS
ncbi:MULTISPECIES: type II toxin-antitoxin system HicB family antitoxin [unclassified Leptolyngbya]|uniref:type II toxin-antitoxin system HicB family antitoxin n=1 Tax=unclassified Leptolyngbya TaxID=2650499 RepID=UPI003D322997